MPTAHGISSGGVANLREGAERRLATYRTATRRDGTIWSSGRFSEPRWGAAVRCGFFRMATTPRLSTRLTPKHFHTASVGSGP